VRLGLPTEVSLAPYSIERFSTGKLLVGKYGSCGVLRGQVAMHLLLLDEVMPEPWRNGGGVTRPLVSAREAGTVSTGPAIADWRLSLADISADAEFSVFPACSAMPSCWAAGRSVWSAMAPSQCGCDPAARQFLR
jgi:hypothetical protein